jgi:hypothetical protein
MLEDEALAQRELPGFAIILDGVAATICGVAG